jgi:two-component system NarL family sensor kinase
VDARQPRRGVVEPRDTRDADLAAALDEANRRLTERVKELECVHGMSRLFDRKGASLEETLQGIAELIPAAWQYPDVAEASILIDSERFQTEGFGDAPWQRSSPIVARDEVVGSVTVCYREERPQCDDGPFLFEEIELLGTVSRRLSSYVERQRVLKSLLSYQQDLRELASALSLSEQHERRRIAEGLHDNIGQNLALVNMRLSAAQHAADREEASSMIAQARELVSDVIADTRTLTFELCPPILYELGLVAALDWLVEQLEAVHGYVAIVRQHGPPLTISEDVAITFFQAARELLINAGRHGRANHVNVDVHNDEDQVRVVVEDDGAGFDPAALAPRSEPHKGFGLFNISERLRLLGGRLLLQSQPGGGTVACLIVPREGRS